MSDHRPGYVYVLINRSMPHLVKIGRTARSPSRRRSELSSATGVPTPFEIVYSVYVSDGSDAEALLHSRLTEGGYRAAENREFFDAPLPVVIDLMLEVERQFPADADAPPLGSHSEGSAASLLDPYEDEEVPDAVRKALEAMDQRRREEARSEVVDEVLKDRDELFRQAAEIVVDHEAGSTSLLQRQLRVGYGRAAHIIDQLHQAGIVGPSKGSRPREVVNRAELMDRLRELGYDVDPTPSPWWKFWA